MRRIAVDIDREDHRDQQAIADAREWCSSFAEDKFDFFEQDCGEGIRAVFQFVCPWDAHAFRSRPAISRYCGRCI